MKKFLTEEQRRELDQETLSSIQSYTNIADIARKSIRDIDRIIENLTSEGKISLDLASKTTQHYHLRRFSEYNLLITLVYLDILTAFRIYINAKENYEAIYSSRQLIVTMNEGYKQLYNFLTVNKYGDVKSRNRNQSYWVKDIGKLIEQELPNLKDSYNRLTRSLERFNDVELASIKEFRDLSIHYNEDASKVYDMLFLIDIEVISGKVVPFIALINEMFTFSKTILLDYNELIQKRNNETANFHISKLEKLKGKNIKINQLLTDMQTWVRSFMGGKPL